MCPMAKAMQEAGGAVVDTMPFAWRTACQGYGDGNVEMAEYDPGEKGTILAQWKPYAARNLLLTI
jgi:hypothetical protein